MRSVVSILLLGSLLASGAQAQCQFSSVVMRVTANGCNVGPTGMCAIPSRPTTLVSGFDSTTCSAEFTVEALDGVCGVNVLVRVLVIGSQPLTTPLPQFGPNCVMWVQPDVVLTQRVGDTFSIQLPPNLPPVIGFQAQAAAFIVSQVSPQMVMTLTDAHAVTIS